MSGDVTIYALCEPGTGTIRYVGRSIDPVARLVEHLRLHDGGQSKRRWLASLAEQGLAPAVRVLEVAREQDAPALERAYIARLRAQGAALTNEHPGCRSMPSRPRPVVVRIMLSLPPEIARALSERAATEATPRSVLVRRWIVRELREGRDRG